MARISAWLWLAVGGAVLQLIALGSDFYIFQENTRSAWLGIPHTSDLMLASAVVTVVLLGLTAANRSPIGGRWVGLAVGAVGLLATAQLVYRMIVPPFGCLQYGCSAGQAKDVTLLAGIWIGLAGNAMTTLGGLGHAFTRRARATEARPWIAARQTGMNPWLGLAALGAIGQFVFGFVGFTFYTVTGFVGNEGEQAWGGWLSLPHTSSLVLAMSLLIVGLVWAAARGRSPINPSALGATIGVLAFVAAGRILYRVFEHPFATAGGSDSQVGSVEVGWAPLLALASAVIALVAGLVQAALHREPRPSAPEAKMSGAGEPASGRA